MIMYDAQICGEVLFELAPGEQAVREAKDIFAACPELSGILANPTFSKEEKSAVIDRLFPNEIRSFLKVMTEFGHIYKINEIFDAYDHCVNSSRNILEAELYYVNRPDGSVMENFRETLKKKYGVSDVLLKTAEDKSLIGGYRLCVNGVEYDKSVSGTIKALQNRLKRR